MGSPGGLCPGSPPQRACSVAHRVVAGAAAVTVGGGRV